MPGWEERALICCHLTVAVTAPASHLDTWLARILTRVLSPSRPSYTSLFSFSFALRVFEEVLIHVYLQCDFSDFVDVCLASSSAP